MTVRSLHVVSWRDLEDPDAGGSERHLHELLRRWAASGIDVTLRTGAARGRATRTARSGYQVERRGGRLGVFLHNPIGEVRAKEKPDWRVEVWHGLPFLAPLWSRVPTVSILHHFHGEQFDEVLPAPAARLASFVERRVAPMIYRNATIATLSNSAKAQLVDRLGYPADHVTVVEPGVDERFSPGGDRYPRPLVLAVARLMPQKGVAELLEVLFRLRHLHPTMEAVIVGDGPEAPRLRASVAAADARSWLDLRGWVDDAELIELYRQAWVVASLSRKEGWGMTVTEAAACGTPSVVSRIPGHVDAVWDGRSGLLAVDADELVQKLDLVLSDAPLRARLSSGAIERAKALSWDVAADQILHLLRGAAASRAS